VSDVTADSTITVVMERDVYTVKWNYEIPGGSGSLSADQTNVGHGTPIAVPADANPETTAQVNHYQYRFVGWYKQTPSDAQKVPSPPMSTQVALSNVTYTAKYETRTFAVTFSVDTSRATVEVTQGTASAVPYGGELKFTVTANTGGQVNSVMVGETTLDSDGEGVYTLSNVRGDTTVTIATNGASYTITWMDGESQFKQETYQYGMLLTSPGIPSKAHTNPAKKYVFDHWEDNDTQVVFGTTTVSGPATYDAVYNEADVTFTVTYSESTLFQVQRINQPTGLEGNEVSYNGSFVCRLVPDANKPEYSQIATKAEVKYRAIGSAGEWSTASNVDGVHTISNITSDLEFMFTDIGMNNYTLTWKNPTGTATYTTTTAVYNESPSDPVVDAGTGKHVDCWKYNNQVIDLTTIHVMSDMEFRAVLADNEYTISWMVGDTVVKTTTAVHGTSPSYGGTPTKAADAQYTYTFSGWSTDGTTVISPLPAATQDTSYKAVFAPVLRSYTIDWKNYDGTLLQRASVPYGTVPSYSGTPTKAADVQYTYTFSGWSTNGTDVVVVPQVTGDAAYIAIYGSTVNKYTVTWADFDATVIGTTQVDYGAAPAHDEVSRQGDIQYTYTFKGWSADRSTVLSPLPEVSGPVTYYAVYDTELVKYTVTWKNWDDSVLKTETVGYGLVPEYRSDPRQAPVRRTQVRLDRMDPLAGPDRREWRHVQGRVRGIHVRHHHHHRSERRDRLPERDSHRRRHGQERGRRVLQRGRRQRCALHREPRRAHR